MDKNSEANGCEAQSVLMRSLDRLSAPGRFVGGNVLDRYDAAVDRVTEAQVKVATNLRAPAVAKLVETQADTTHRVTSVYRSVIGV
jgi:hypothetical protein